MSEPEKHKYRLHVYVVRDEPYDGIETAVLRREDLETGQFEMLRLLSTDNPEALVKSFIDVGADAVLYEITDAQLLRNAWNEAVIVPEREDL